MTAAGRFRRLDASRTGLLDSPEATFQRDARIEGRGAAADADVRMFLRCAVSLFTVVGGREKSGTGLCLWIVVLPGAVGPRRMNA